VVVEAAVAVAVVEVEAVAGARAGAAASNLIGRVVSEAPVSARAPWRIADARTRAMRTRTKTVPQV
tara:strand:+ start:3398 stop:3595 length:198 start_codon:yes stop_codon:yes gene_type:complete